MFAQRFVQHLAEHYFSVLEAFTMDPNNHSFAINVADSHICQFSTPCASGIQRHQQHTVKREIRLFDQQADFFGAQCNCSSHFVLLPFIVM